ncbi:MAG TPA: histidine kinase, partial [Gammaproteobacteria bacterium]|nr:histidine kinase [Gammaproteobacteria bacterium]
MHTDSPTVVALPPYTDAALGESEAPISARLNRLLSPDSDIGALELSDIIDVPALQTLLDQFFKLTGIGVAIIDIQGRVLVATGWQDICVKFYRIHPATCENCVESDTALTQGIEPGTFKRYRCKNQMYDIATPIIVSEQHLGNLFLGQFFFDDEPPNRELFRAQARRYGFDEEDYLAALDRTPRWSRDTVNTVLEFYAGLTRMFSNLSYSNLRLMRSMIRQQQTEESLRRREAQYRAIMETSQDGFWMTTPDGQLLEVNETYVRLSGYTRQELLTMRIADLEVKESAEEIAAHIKTVVSQGGDLFETRHRTKSGRLWS